MLFVLVSYFAPGNAWANRVGLFLELVEAGAIKVKLQ
jgi:hypothetical protein